VRTSTLAHKLWNASPIAWIVVLYSLHRTEAYCSSSIHFTIDSSDSTASQCQCWSISLSSSARSCPPLLLSSLSLSHASAIILLPRPALLDAYSRLTFERSFSTSAFDRISRTLHTSSRQYHSISVLQMSPYAAYTAILLSVVQAFV